MTDKDRTLIHIPKEGNYIEILGYKIDGFDSFESFCEYLKKFAEMGAEIEKLKAEIERLTVNMNAFGLGMKREKERADTARTEAIKEFAERLKEYGYGRWVSLSYKNFDNLVKEMTGETKTADFPKDYSYGY